MKKIHILGLILSAALTAPMAFAQTETLISSKDSPLPSTTRSLEAISADQLVEAKNEVGDIVRIKNDLGRVINSYLTKLQQQVGFNFQVRMEKGDRLLIQAKEGGLAGSIKSISCAVRFDVDQEAPKLIVPSLEVKLFGFNAPINGEAIFTSMKPEFFSSRPENALVLLTRAVFSEVSASDYYFVLNGKNWRINLLAENALGFVEPVLS